MSATKTFTVSNDINITVNESMIDERYDFEKGVIYVLKKEGQAYMHLSKILKASVVMEYIDANGKIVCEWLSSVFEAAARFSWALGAIEVNSVKAIQEHLAKHSISGVSDASEDSYDFEVEVELELENEIPSSSGVTGSLPEGFDYII